jgi:hypothetical protein
LDLFRWLCGFVALVLGLVLMALNRTQTSDASVKVEQRYYISIDGEVTGPFTLRELISKKRDKSIEDSTLCCLEETEQWIPFSEL